MQVFCQVKDQKLYPARQKRSVHGGHSWNNMFILQGVNCATGNGAGGSRGGGESFLSDQSPHPGMLILGT